jgi:general secretion pathway protein D
MRRRKMGWGNRWGVLCLLLLVMQAPLYAADTSQRSAMTLNLRDADITSVISTVSEMTGKNFIVDPRVKGRVTVISSRPMEADEVYQVFLSILNVQGFAAIPGKNAIKIVPEVTAKQGAIPNKGGIGDESVTRVVPVNNVAAAQLVPVLRPLLPQEAHLAAYTPTNVLIVSSTAANVDKLMELIRTVDQSNESEIELIHLKHASATEVERILNSLQQQNAANRAAGAAGGDNLKITADGRTNSIILSGDKAARQGIKAIIAKLDTKLESSGNTRVFYLHYAKAKDLASVLGGVGESIVADKSGSGAQGASASGKNKLNIQADESSNALVISAPPDVMRDLEAVIRQLDVRRAQVMVKAVIADISTDSSRELGVQWAYDGSAADGPVGLIDFNGLMTGIATAAASGGTVAPPSLNGANLGLGQTLSDGTVYGALLKALKGDSNNNILSTPTLVTMDNEEAEFTVGQNVPFITGSYTSTGSSSSPSNPFQTIERQDVGLTLKITPQINEGNSVRMEIAQEVSSISGSSASTVDLITNKRSIKTTVMVDDGDILVLGGLLDDQLIENEQKVPLLGDIPVLGWFFSYRSTSKVKRDLMIFLHPRIMREGKLSNDISSAKYNYMRAQQMAMRERGVALMSDDVSPLLPEMKDFLELPPPYEETPDATQDGTSSSVPATPEPEAPVVQDQSMAVAPRIVVAE